MGMAMRNTLDPFQLHSWKNQLPIQTILVFLNAVVPSIKTLHKGSAEDGQAVLKYLKGRNKRRRNLTNRNDVGWHSPASSPYTLEAILSPPSSIQIC
jgi:hypothetical protein